jgi:hypothetical protein
MIYLFFPRFTFIFKDCLLGAPPVWRKDVAGVMYRGRVGEDDDKHLVYLNLSGHRMPNRS